MPVWLVQELLRFGAIYTCRVMPDFPPEVAAKMSQQKLQQAAEARSKAKESVGKNPSYSIPRRVTSDVLIEQYAFIRVHCHPKRFPAAHDYKWKDRIVHNAADFVVANKPPCIPTAPTVDNLLESCPACVGMAIGHDGPLHITSRLDQCTEGLLLLAKSPGFAALYNHLQRSKTEEGEACVQKFYRALSLVPPPTGLLEHFLKLNQRRQGQAACTMVHVDASEGGRPSELVVLEVRQVQLCGTAAESWGPTAFEAFIELRTGRTHQIRAQLAAVGSPLCGDTLYGPPTAEMEAKAREVGGGPRAVVPKMAIGLQCARLRVANLEKGGDWRSAHQGAVTWRVFEAGTPWWRQYWHLMSSAKT